jgi:hypothetical protein
MVQLLSVKTVGHDNSIRGRWIGSQCARFAHYDERVNATRVALPRNLTDEQRHSIVSRWMNGSRLESFVDIPPRKSGRLLRIRDNDPCRDARILLRRRRTPRHTRRKLWQRDRCRDLANSPPVDTSPHSPNQAQCTWPSLLHRPRSSTRRRSDRRPLRSRCMHRCNFESVRDSYEIPRRVKGEFNLLSTDLQAGWFRIGRGATPRFPDSGVRSRARRSGPPTQGFHCRPHAEGLG